MASSSRALRERYAGDGADERLDATWDLPTRPAPRVSPERVDSRQHAVDESSEDDHNLKPRSRRRGHDYRNVQARDNARVQLGDTTYIAKQVVYSRRKGPSGAGEDGRKIDLLEALEFEHMGIRLASIRAAHDHTCRWLFETDEYLQWRRRSRRSRYRFLWIKGKPGSGKSTLMATALEQAPRDFRHSVVVSFFFNARGNRMGKSIEGMYRSLLHQIFSQLPELPPGVSPQVGAFLKRQGWPVPMLQNMLQTMLLHLDHDQKLVCYVDALDECDEDSIREALRHFEELRDLAIRHDTKFLVCLASRHYPDITIRHHRAINIDEQSGHQADISEYMKGALHVPGTLGTKLHDFLLDRCAGSFLWVVLTVGRLNKMNDRGATRSQLWTHVKEIPERVQDLFREILQHRDEYLLPILQWVLYAKATLNVEQLYFAAKVSTGRLVTGVWDKTEIGLSRMKKFLLASSKGLIEFPQGTGYMPGRAQLIHESLREYLLDGGLSELDTSMRSQIGPTSHARLAQWCVEYIALDSAHYISKDLGGPMTPLRQPRFDEDALPLLHYVLEYVGHHITEAHAAGVLPHSTLERFANCWLTCKLYRFAYADLDCAALLYFSLIQHGDKYQEGDFGSMQVPQASLSRPWYWNSYTEIEWQSSRDTSTRWLPYQTAARTESMNLVQLFRDRSTSKAFGHLVRQVLLRSATQGHQHVLDLLLHYVGKLASKCLNEGLLYHAAVQLQRDTTKFFLQLGTNPNEGKKSILCSLARTKDLNHAAKDRHPARIEIAMMLMDSGADTKGALLSACKARDTSLIRLLAARGATISRSALRTARNKGRHEMIDMIHEAGALVGDSEHDSADTSDASTVAVRGV